MSLEAQKWNPVKQPPDPHLWPHDPFSQWNTRERKSICKSQHPCFFCTKRGCVLFFWVHTWLWQSISSFSWKNRFVLLATTVALLSLWYILLALVTPSCLDWAIFLFIIPFSAFLTSNQGPLLIYVSIQMLFWGRGGAFIWMHNGMGLGAVPLIVWVLPAEQNWLLIGQYIVMFIACHNKRINECSVPLTIALAFWRDLLSLLVVGFQLLTCQF